MKRITKTVKYHGASQQFIKDNPKLKKRIGRPIISQTGEDFYPIWDEELYIRYYMSRSCCIYDMLEDQVKKYFPCLDAHLISTVTGEEKIVPVEELYWRTFYRFPMGHLLPRKPNGRVKHLNLGAHFTGDEQRGYCVEGILFKIIKFRENSKLYETFVTREQGKLAISEDGAIFDIKKGKFRQILLTIDGMPYIQSKNGVRVLVPHLIAMGWLENGYSYQSYNIHTVAESGIFCSTGNLIYRQASQAKTDLVTSHGLVIQDVCSGGDDIGEVIYPKRNWTVRKWDDRIAISSLEKEFGKFYRIPLEGLYNNYIISKNGLIYSIARGKVLTPSRVISTDDGRGFSIRDLEYEFPEIGKTLSVAEIMLWTFYRLLPDDVAEVIPTIQIHRKRKILIVTNLLFVSKGIPQVDVDCIISEKVYRHSTVYPTLYISKTGAIYDILSKNFIDYSNIHTIGAFQCIRIKIYDKERYVNLGILVYTTWFSSTLPRGTTVCSKNGISEDVSMHNLTLTLLPLSTIKDTDITRIQKLSEKLPSIKDNECKMVASEYGCKCVGSINMLRYFT